MEGRASNQKYKGKQFKSMGETQVARLLDRLGVAYLYEHPLAVLDDGKVRIWYPDFQLPGYGVLIEYFGMNGSPEYDKGARKKQAVYEGNGLSVIILRPDALTGNWPDRILDRIEGVLEERLIQYREKRVTATARRYSPQGAE